MVLKFDRFHCKLYKDHPMFSEVDMFYRSRGVGGVKQKTLLSQSFRRDFNIISKNVLLASNNPGISKEIMRTYGAKKETQWLTVGKHLSNVLRMDMVVLMNTYCNLRSREQYWEVYYYSPAPTDMEMFKRGLMFGDTSDEDEQDLSLNP